ncbi:MAG: ATP-binding protein [Myxococcales bacterium]|nr:ATP-binding protein [Myxococcales bacterium]
MTETHTNLAEQALDNLVNQFARPLDFLRELVQNSIDAGSPRIEVRIDYEPPKEGQAHGVTIVNIDDWGEGMDESIIDNQLTRLFSSAKEGDLTKIGKFGIGFTSIFAIHPEIVQLRTGRHGENWELLFQQDRSFLKNPIDEPVDGTKIKLFKRMSRQQVEKFVEEARFILTYWCEHSNVPVTFWDNTGGSLVEVVDGDDPFAAFASESATPDVASGPEVVNRPLDAVESDLWVHLRRDDVEAVVGVGPQPLFGYYNGGLTLLRTRNRDSLGEYDSRVQHLVFKVKNDALEHTLTRDNVLHDAHWHRAMKIVLEGRVQLVERLVARVSEAVADPATDERVWQAHLARLCDADDTLGMVRGHGDAPLFVSALGTPLTLDQVARQNRTLGAVLVWDDEDALARGIRDAGQEVVRDSPEARALLEVTHDSGMFGRTQLMIARADSFFVLPEVVDLQTLDDQERKLVEHTRELLTKTVGMRLRSVRLGDFGGPEAGATEALVVDGASEDGVFMRRQDSWYHRFIEWLPSILRARHILINRHHPLYRAQLLASTENRWLAAAGLASAILHVEDIEPERNHRVLLTLAHSRLEIA